MDELHPASVAKDATLVDARLLNFKSILLILGSEYASSSAMPTVVGYVGVFATKQKGNRLLTFLGPFGNVCRNCSGSDVLRHV